MGKPKILVTRRITESALDRLHEEGQVILWDDQLPPSHDQLTGMLEDCEGLLCLLTDNIDRELLVSASKLRVVSTMSVGFEHIDLETCRNHGIKVGHTPGVLTETTADFTMALMLSVSRRIPEAIHFAQSGQWKTWDPGLLLGQDLHNAVVGIIGMGRIGQAVARRIFAFGSQLLYHDLSRVKVIEKEFNAEAVELDILLNRVDIVSLHVPLTERTYQMISHPQFETMKPSSILINTSRGAVIDTNALLQALREGKIAAAGLDVTDPEPLPHNHPLYKLHNCFITPHIASAGAATRAKMANMAVDNLLAGLHGKPLPNPVA
ncbi:MAG: glyoxylate reductase [Anaerolineae bacterium SM23_ 63]|nr:MAG: glyoxylate reductase [Anaerolineae bacterium SM23_ 63]